MRMVISLQILTKFGIVGWKNYYSQLLTVHRVGDVRQIEMHIYEPLGEVEIAVANFKKYNLPGSDQIPTELIQQKVKYYSLRSMYSFCVE
jgi:hypothetical protein